MKQEILAVCRKSKIILIVLLMGLPGHPARADEPAPKPVTLLATLRQKSPRGAILRQTETYVKQDERGRFRGTVSLAQSGSDYLIISFYADEEDNEMRFVVHDSSVVRRGSFEGTEYHRPLEILDVTRSFLASGSYRIMRGDTYELWLFLTPVSGEAEEEHPDAEPESESEDGFIGLGKADAGELAEKRGLKWRVVEEDGERFPVTLDHREDRVNFTIEDGKVVDVKRG